MKTKTKAFRYSLILGVVGLVVSASVGLIENRIISSYRQNISRESLGFKIKSQVSNAHIAFNKLMSGNNQFNFDKDVLSLYQKSKSTLSGVLSGDGGEYGQFKIKGDEIATGLINTALNDLNILETKANDLWKSHKAGATNAGVTNSFQEAHMDFETTIDSLIEHLNEGTETHFIVLQRWSWVSISLILLVFATLTFQLYRIQNKNDKLTDESRKQLERETLRVESMSNFIEAVSVGNYTMELQRVDDDDHLTDKLINMRNKLKENAEEDSRRNWSTSGLAQIGEILRTTTASVADLYDSIIRFVVKYTNSNQGGIFLVNDDEENERSLDLVACYAFERKKFLKKKVEIGQGLVGQCYLEQEKILMMKVPEDYVSITSGLGGANPNCVLLVPMKVNEKIYGVIEIASFKKYHPHEIELVEKFAESIASTISTVRTNESTKLLLEKSQQQAEEMKAQEEEMRQNMEELSATQEEMTRKNTEVERLLADSSKKEEELRLKLEEVAKMKQVEEIKTQERIAFIDNYKKTLLGVLDNLPHKIFLKDQDGKMVIVNTAVAKAHHLSVDELIGKSDFDFVDAKTAQEWRNQELEIIRKGSETYVHSDSIGGETRKLKTVKSAFYIPHLNQTGLLGVQTDVTDFEK